MSSDYYQVCARGAKKKRRRNGIYSVGLTVNCVMTMRCKFWRLSETVFLRVKFLSENAQPTELSVTQITFNGSCLSDVTSQSQFMTSLSLALYASHACLTSSDGLLAATSRALADICDVNNYVINCGSSQGQQRKRRRDTNPMTVTILLQFLTRWLTAACQAI